MEMDSSVPAQNPLRAAGQFHRTLAWERPLFGGPQLTARKIHEEKAPFINHTTKGGNIESRGGILLFLEEQKRNREGSIVKVKSPTGMKRGKEIKARFVPLGWRKEDPFWFVPPFLFPLKTGDQLRGLMRTVYGER